LILVLFAFGAMIAGEALADDWYSRLWGYRKMITVQAGQVIGGPHTNFPMLVSISSDADLAANAQPDFDDILFATSDGTMKLDHEIESFDSGTGALIAWVRIPAPGINNGTVIYMYYGNSSVGSQQNITGTWNSNYKGVWHLKEEQGGTGTSNVYLDSTINNNDGDDYISATGRTGKINNGKEFDGVDDYVSIPDDSTLDIEGSLTISLWIYPNEIVAWVRDGLLTKRESNTGYRIGLDDEGWCDVPAGDSIATIGFHYGTGGALYGACSNQGVIYPNEWAHIAVVNNNADNSVVIYKNGTALGTLDLITVMTGTNSRDLTVGSGFDTPFNGFIDEVRISDTNRSAGWIETSYNNQNNPTSSPYFLSFDAQELVTVPTITELGMIIFMVLAGLGAIYYLRRRRATP